jgi:hypothetical protein
VGAAKPTGSDFHCWVLESGSSSLSFSNGTPVRAKLSVGFKGTFRRLITEQNAQEWLVSAQHTVKWNTLSAIAGRLWTTNACPG